jgi:hypothetical protein
MFRGRRCTLKKKAFKVQHSRDSSRARLKLLCVAKRNENYTFGRRCEHCCVLLCLPVHMLLFCCQIFSAAASVVAER